MQNTIIYMEGSELFILFDISNTFKYMLKLYSEKNIMVTRILNMNYSPQSHHYIKNCSTHDSLSISDT